MTLYLSQERWGRVVLHVAAALRAGHWSWHFAGIGRQLAFIRPSPIRLQPPRMVDRG